MLGAVSSALSLEKDQEYLVRLASSRSPHSPEADRPQTSDPSENSAHDGSPERPIVLLPERRQTPTSPCTCNFPPWHPLETAHRPVMIPGLPVGGCQITPAFPTVSRRLRRPQKFVSDLPLVPSHPMMPGAEALVLGEWRDPCPCFFSEWLRILFIPCIVAGCSSLDKTFGSCTCRRFDDRALLKRKKACRLYAFCIAHLNRYRPRETGNIWTEEENAIIRERYPSCRPIS